MLTFRQRETVQAEQWFPGSNLSFVVGDNPNMLCGCVMFGGPSDKVHVHIGEHAYLISPNDWIVYENGKPVDVMHDYDFIMKYIEVSK